MARKMLVSAFVVALMSLLSVRANAGLLVDLRFASGSPGLVNAHSVDLGAGGAGAYTVEVWAQVRGTNTLNDEGLLNVYGSVQSAQIAGGTVLSGNSGVTANSGFGPEFTTSSPNGQPGTLQNLTVDGVKDWGTTAGTTAIKYNSTETAGSGLDPVYNTTAGATFNNLNTGNVGVEFKVGEFIVTIQNADINLASNIGAETRFNWIKGTGAAPPSHSHREDGGASAITSAATYAASASPTNSVSFGTVPEPGSLGIMALSLLGFLGRRRRA